MPTWTNLGNGTALENQTNFRLTFVDSGGGTGTAVPVQYMPAGERLTRVKNLADVLEDHTAYKINSITTYVSVNADPDVPDDPGGDVPGDTWLGFFDAGGGIRHKVSFHLPGALFPDANSGETLGQAIASALGAGYVFRKWAGATN